jgi:hypothetical protein
MAEKAPDRYQRVALGREASRRLLQDGGCHSEDELRQIVSYARQWIREPSSRDDKD